MRKLTYVIKADTGIIEVNTIAEAKKYAGIANAPYTPTLSAYAPRKQVSLGEIKAQIERNKRRPLAYLP